MQHLRRRCKHCHREYIYCTYGNGEEYGTEAGCSMDYCADCQKAIDDALNKIPIKFGSRRMEITPTKELLMLFKKVKEDQEKADSAAKDSGMPIIRAVPFSHVWGGDYDNFDSCTFNGRTFTIEWNDDTPDDVHVTVEMEYDFLEKKFTDNYWSTDRRNCYTHSRPTRITELHDVKPMSEPIGQLYWMDPIWDLECNTKHEPVEIPHEKISYTRVYDGNTVKRILSDKRHDTKVAYQLDKELYPFMDYEVVYEKYRDEDFETITDVKLKF